MPAPTFGARLLRLGSESLVYGLSSIVGRLLSFLLQPYYAHRFDPAQNGVQSVVYSYIPIISIGLYLGMDVAYMRLAAFAGTGATSDHAAAAVDDAAERRRAFTMTFGMIALIGAVVTLVALAAAPWLAPIATLDVTSFRYMMAIVFTDALLAVPYAHLRMTDRSMRYAVLRLLFVAISVGLNIVLIGRLHWGVEAIFIANLAANLAVLLLFLGEIAGNVRPALLRSAPWRALWAYALPIIPTMLAVMIVENGDRIVLTHLPGQTAAAVYGMTSKDVVGIYGFNYKLGVAMLLVVQMFRMAWTPFSLQLARDPRAPQLFSRVLTALMLVCALVFLGVSILLPSLVRVPVVHRYVKPAYWSGLAIVPVILLGYAFSGMYAVVTAGLYIAKHTRALPWIAGAGALLNVAMCIVAQSHWGLVGVAWATPAAYALMAALGAWRSNQAFPVPFEWLRLLHLAAVVGVLFAADRVIAARGVDAISATGLAAKCALIVALPAALAATGFFRDGEWKVLRALIPRTRPA